MPELIISGGGGAAAALQTVSSILGADVALAANTDTLVTSVSLPAGTWLVLGQLAVTGATAATVVSAALKVSGGAVLSTGEDVNSSVNGFIQLTPAAIVALAATTTIELRSEAAIAATAKAAVGFGYLTNVATQLLAVKLG